MPGPFVRIFLSLSPSLDHLVELRMETQIHDTNSEIRFTKTQPEYIRHDICFCLTHLEIHSVTRQAAETEEKRGFLEVCVCVYVHASTCVCVCV